MENDRRRELIRLGAAAFLVLILVAFVIDNSQEVTIGFLVSDVEIPLILVLIGTAVIGAVVDRLLKFRSRKD